jgi:hypothetical protein
MLPSLAICTPCPPSAAEARVADAVLAAEVGQPRRLQFTCLKRGEKGNQVRRPDVGRLVEFGVQPESGCTQRRSPASTARRRDPTLNVFWFQNQRHSSPLVEREPVISEVVVPVDYCAVTTPSVSGQDAERQACVFCVINDPPGGCGGIEEIGTRLEDRPLAVV